MEIPVTINRLYVGSHTETRPVRPSDNVTNSPIWKFAISWEDDDDEDTELVFKPLWPDDDEDEDDADAAVDPDDVCDE